MKKKEKMVFYCDLQNHYRYTSSKNSVFYSDKYDCIDTKKNI